MHLITYEKVNQVPFVKVLYLKRLDPMADPSSIAAFADDLSSKYQLFVFNEGTQIAFFEVSPFLCWPTLTVFVTF